MLGVKERNHIIIFWPSACQLAHRMAYVSESTVYNLMEGLHYIARTSAANPDSNPDPLVFGPPGSGSLSQMYGSGSFCHHTSFVNY